MIGAVLPVTPMVAAIRGLYGITKDVGDYLGGLIEDMKGSGNQTINRVGRVLEAAKFGFGIGYMTPTIIIALGQLLLGNELAAVVTVVTMPFNPISMTCAAVGAIYFGWNALTEKEREDVLDRLREGLSIGVEMIKAIIAFVIKKSKELLSAENLVEFKRFIREAATAFDRTLSDVTRSIKDRAADTYRFVARKFKRERAAKPVLPA